MRNLNRLNSVDRRILNKLVFVHLILSALLLSSACGQAIAAGRSAKVAPSEKYLAVIPPPPTEKGSAASSLSIDQLKALPKDLRNLIYHRSDATSLAKLRETSTYFGPEIRQAGIILDEVPLQSFSQLETYSGRTTSLRRVRFLSEISTEDLEKCLLDKRLSSVNHLSIERPVQLVRDTRIAEALISLRRISRLSLRVDHSEDAVHRAIQLTKIFIANPNLISFHLVQSQLTGLDVHPLLIMISERTQIEELDLSNNRIAKDGVEDLIHLLEVHRHLNLLNLNDNLIDDESATLLSDALSTIDHLHEVYLENNSIHEMGAQALYATFTQAKHLSVISIRGNRAGFFLARKFKNLIKERSKTPSQLSDSSYSD